MPIYATNRLRIAVALVATCLLASPRLCAQLDLTIETIALDGETAPGTGDIFSTFDVALINGLGQVVFHSRLPNSLDESVWLWDPSTGLELQSRANINRIETKSIRFSNAGVGHGQSETVNELIAPDLAGNPQVIAADGGAAPGGGTFDISSSDEDDIAVSDAGIFFETEIDDGASLEALFRQNAGFALEEVFRVGDLAPGAGGETFVDFTDGVLNNDGDLVFEANIDLVGTRALFGPTAGGLSLLAKTGDTPPGVAGAQFRGFGADWTALSVNDANQVAFQGNMLIGPGGVTGTDDTGIWGPAGGGAFQLVARTGSSAPGAGSATFALLDTVALNSQSSLSFLGALTGAGIDSSNDYGLWAARQGATPQLVLREGDAAPGLTGEMVGSQFDFNSTLLGNDTLVLAAELASGGAAIWLYNLVANTIELVLGPGEDVTVAQGDVRTITKAWFGDASDLEIHSGGEDGKKTIANSSDQIAALLEFSDASFGVFRLTIDDGVCAAANGEDLVLSDDTVTGVESYEVCGTISVGPNYSVESPGGFLTLRAGDRVEMGNGVSVVGDGRLVVELDDAL